MANRPRVFLIAGFAVIGCLYLLYATSVIMLMVAAKNILCSTRVR